MDKTINGIVYKKAKFLRTTCKYCGKELNHGLILQDKKFCNKTCNNKYSQRRKRG